MISPCFDSLTETSRYMYREGKNGGADRQNTGQNLVLVHFRSKVDGWLNQLVAPLWANLRETLFFA